MKKKSRGILRIFCVALLLGSAFAALLLPAPAVADEYWNQTSGTNNWNTSGNWNGGVPSFNNATAWLTNKVSAGGVVDVASINNNAQTYQLVISNGLSGSSGLMEILASGNSGGLLQFNYGTIGAGGAIVISNSTMIDYTAFQINSGGTLVLNSGSLQNEGSVNDYQIGGSLVVGGSQGGGRGGK